ncbi:aminopeptidase [Goodfellowiella coeruleoviolacea]|uniref:Aminopeptidase n=2 Tax=Goodfellowiella coeruleoviolacea TaxID=334858 RepID=A0AAE3GGN1_9PSEU|nr:aminopeptidase [Goodfellowiella coeruleoviolacea]
MARAGRGGRVPVVAAVAVAALAAVAVLAGCGRTIAGQARPLGAIDPGTVAGLPVTDGASGPRSGVADADLPVENADGGEMDKLAINAIADVEEYWKQQFPSEFGKQFEPVKRYVSYDSNGRGVNICRTNTAGVVNAFYCSLEDSIAWDRGELLPLLDDEFGPMSVVTVLAHEMGHAVQYKLGAASGVDDNTPSIVKEQQADCYAGTFFRWVAEGKAPHFQISTGKGLNQVLSAMFFIRDEAGSSYTKQGAHGSAFDRVSAFQFGFSMGPKRCAKISLDEYEQRKTEVAFDANDRNEGNLPVNAQAMTWLKVSLDEAYRDSGAAAPAISDKPSSCSDAKQTSPAAYCPATNTVTVVPQDLMAIGATPGRGSTGLGDFAAFAEVASRYTLAVQKAAGLPLDNQTTALRTACLTGAWARATVTGTDNPENKLRLSPGDLDEAVGELLREESLIAADVNGESVKAGFARVESFRVGFLDGQPACAKQFG